MSNVANRFKVGIFVLIGMILIVASFLLVGALQYFRPKINFMTVVNTSVQGLELGAKVKYRGVAVGKVSEIEISAYDDNIWIFMEYIPGDDETISLHTSYERWQEELFKTLDKLIEKGLRTQLRYEGITGNMYVEIDFLDPEQFPADMKVKLPPKHPFYIPSAPRISMENMIEKFKISLDRISKIDFEKIARDMQNLIENANQIIKSDEIKNMLKDLNSVSKKLQALSSVLTSSITKEKVDKVLDDLDHTMDNFNNMLYDVHITREQLCSSLKEIEKTLTLQEI